MNSKIVTAVLILLFVFMITLLAQEQSAPGTGMTGKKLSDLIRSIDPQSSNQDNAWQFMFEDRLMLVVFDENADRMRLFSPIGPENRLDAEQLRRMLQANFDSALDARYALANKLIWSIFMHPLSPLDNDEFASAVIQVYNVAESFGGSYSSGLFTYGGGDSIEENRKLLEELKKRINPTT